MPVRAAILGLLGLGVVCAAAEPKTPTLLLKVFDEQGSPCSARLRVFDSQSRPTSVRALDPPSLTPVHPNFPELGAIIPRQARVAVPAGRTTLALERGPEYLRVQIEIDLGAGENLERSISFHRWTDMAAKGWWSGDLHVHRTPEDLTALIDASDLHFASTITCFNDSLTLKVWPRQTISDIGSDRVFSVDNCEDERRWGAAIFIGVKFPISLYPRNTEYPPPAQTWGAARQRGAFIDLEKVIWWESPVMAALNPPDSIGVAVNHFLEDTVSTRASLARPRDEVKYAGAAGFARYILDLYATYLSAGFRIAASAGSANGVARNVLGYNRSYVYLGPKFSYEAWLAGQKAGHNFVTNGPMMSFSVNGKMPGSILRDEPGEISVAIDCQSQDEMDRAEVIEDGEIVAVFRVSPGASRISATRKLNFQPGGRIAARCFERNPVTVRFAHSSPVYFGREARRSTAAMAYLRDWVDAEMRRLRQAPPDLLTAPQREELLELCRKARERYQ
jgi:TolB protein